MSYRCAIWVAVAILVLGAAAMMLLVRHGDSASDADRLGGIQPAEAEPRDAKGAVASHLLVAPVEPDSLFSRRNSAANGAPREARVPSDAAAGIEEGDDASSVWTSVNAPRNMLGAEKPRPSGSTGAPPAGRDMGSSVVAAGNLTGRSPPKPRDGGGSQATGGSAGGSSKAGHAFGYPAATAQPRGGALDGAPDSNPPSSAESDGITTRGSEGQEPKGPSGADDLEDPSGAGVDEEQGRDDTRRGDDTDGEERDGPAPDGPPTVLMLANSAEAIVGDFVAVTVRIENGQNVGSIPFHVLFDPAVLGFERGEEGDYLLADGRQTAFFAAPTSGGDTVVVGLSRLGRGEGMSGSGELCTLYFSAVGPGDAGVAFARGKVRDAFNSIVPSNFLGTRIVIK